jgi:DNA-directed RNA polymerase specialized sigma subunit
MMAAKNTDYDTELSIEAVAKALGVSKPTALMIQKKAIEKFKRALERRGIRLHDLVGE